LPGVHLPIFLANKMCKDHPAFRIVTQQAPDARDRLSP
jgi:hypothetical protein